MIAYAVLLLAVFSRIVPALFHPAVWNFTAVGGGLLFFGSRLRSSKTVEGAARRRSGGAAVFARLASAVAAFAAMDYVLTAHVYHYPFHVRGYLLTWAWYGAVCLLGMGLLQRPSFLRVGAGVLASASSFFLISNFATWAGGHMYPLTSAGLAACYAAGVPFYRNDLVSTALTATALFGVPALAAKIVESMEASQGQPVA